MSHFGNMVMSGVGFTVLYSDTVRIVLLPGCFNYLTTTKWTIPIVQLSTPFSLSLERKMCQGLFSSPLAVARNMVTLVLVVMELMLQLESEHFYLFHLYNSLHSLKRHCFVGLIVYSRDAEPLAPVPILGQTEISTHTGGYQFCLF